MTQQSSSNIPFNTFHPKFKEKKFLEILQALITCIFLIAIFYPVKDYFTFKTILLLWLSPIH